MGLDRDTASDDFRSVICAVRTDVMFRQVELNGNILMTSSCVALRRRALEMLV